MFDQVVRYVAWSGLTSGIGGTSEDDWLEAGIRVSLIPVTHMLIMLITFITKKSSILSVEQHCVFSFFLAQNSDHLMWLLVPESGL